MSKHLDYEGHEHLPLAYRNTEFLDAPEGRSLRILSEYLYPLAHFRKERVHDTVVFFGSARLMEMGPLGRYYNEARELARRLTVWSGEAWRIPLAGSWCAAGAARASWKRPIAALATPEAKP